MKEAVLAATIECLPGSKGIRNCIVSMEVPSMWASLCGFEVWCKYSVL